jgi:hypothetical protein
MNTIDEVMQELLQVKQAEVERFKTLENLFAHLQRASNDLASPIAATQTVSAAHQIPRSSAG